MSDQIKSEPLWLTRVNEAYAAREAAEQQAAEEERLREEAEQKTKRDQALRDFATSLRIVLGDEIANDLLGGPDVMSAPAKRISIPPYDLCYEKPGGDLFASMTGERHGPIYTVGIGRPLPPEFGNKGEYISDIKTFDGFLDALKKIDRAYEISLTRHAERVERERIEAERRQQREEERLKLEAEEMKAQLNAATEPAKPELDQETVRLTDYLRYVADDIEKGNVWDENEKVLVAILRYLIVQHFIDR